MILKKFVKQGYNHKVINEHIQKLNNLNRCKL